jgi:subtilisin family serine protease
MRAFLVPLALASLVAAAAPLHAQTSSELIVGLAPPSPLAGGASAQRARLAERLGALGLTPRGSLTDGLPLTRAAAGPVAPLRVNPFDFDPARVWRMAARDSIAALAASLALAQDPEVEWVEPNQVREVADIALEPGFPSDPMYRDTRQWALHNAGPGSAYNGKLGADIHALEAWAVSTGSNDLRLAIADTGIDPNHPEYQAVMPDGSMRIDRGINVTLDPSPSFADSFGHGVAVAGVMAARTNEGWHFADSLGVAGVCGGNGRDNLGCHLVPIKIAPGHSGEASSFDIARAMIYSVQVGARAMNLSFAGDGTSRVERLAMYYAITRGCVVCAASGNQGFLYGTKPQYPAAYSVEGLCIQAGATDWNDVRAAFSSYGPGLDLMAPGVNIWTTYLTYPHPITGLVRNGYARDSGTSYAAPHVCGAVGLLAAARPELEADDFQRILRESADDIGDPGVDQKTGWGRLNVAKALAAVRPSLGIWHDEVLGQVASIGPSDTLVLTESGPGTFDRWRTWHDAMVLEVRATVAIPDSFLDSIRVWPRVGGTMTVRGDFRIPYFTPWSEVIAQDAHSFTLRGYIYRQSDATCSPCGDDAYLPLPPDQARFGFTVIGRVDRSPTVTLTPPAGGLRLAPGEAATLGLEARDPDRVSAVEVWLDCAGHAPLRLARLPGDATQVAVVAPCMGAAGGTGALRVRALDEHGPCHDQGEASVPIAIAGSPCVESAAAALSVRAGPNPFDGFTRITAPGAGRVEIVDAFGRRVRGVTLEADAPTFGWDGRDEHGRAVRPGIYFARYAGPAGRSLVKMVKLDAGAVHALNR